MTQKDLFEEDPLSSQVDIHVSHFQSQVVGEAKKTLATSIRTSKELLNKSDPLGQFTKMFMDTSQWDLTRFSFKWKALVTQRGRLCFRLVQSEHCTKGTEFGSLGNTWATPNTMDHLPPRSEEATKKLQNGHRKGRKRPSNLREQVDPNTIKLYPTPRASDVEGGMASNVEINNGRFSRKNKDGVRWGVKLRDAVNHMETFPTPRASEYKDCGAVGSKSQIHMDNRSYLCAKVKDPQQPSGKLNPVWTEWLMGYPKGWTELKD